MNQICDSCGKEFTSKTKKATCSTDCLHILKHGSLENYHRTLAARKRAAIIRKYGSITNFNKSRKAKKEAKIIQEHGSLEKYNEIRKAKKEAKIIQEYGSLENHKVFLEAKSKAKKISKYGSLENYNKVNQDTKRKNAIAKYGSLDAANNATKEKIELTLISKYGSLEKYNKIKQEKIKETILSKYGSLENYNKITIEKRKVTSLEKHGKENFNNSEKTKETMLKKYGEISYTQTEEFKEKRKETMFTKYGSYYTKTDEYKEKRNNTFIDKYGSLENYYLVSNLNRKETCIENMGVEHCMQNPEVLAKTLETKRAWSDEFKAEIQKKQYLTKKKNNSFNSSKAEDDMYIELCKKYKEVKRQYNSIEYPFNCDFYIPEENLYIEYQGSWTHGDEPFDRTNSKHIEKLEIMKEKAKSSKYWANAITTWTIRDVKKRKIAAKNNLNYIEIF